MALRTPNKEVVRRICLLNGGTECHMLVETAGDYVELLTDIPKEKISNCIIDLKEWSGIKFKIYNLNAKNKEVKKILLEGEKILPINF